MAKDIFVVGLCGSRRQGSFTHVALQRAISGSQDAGAATAIYSLQSLDVPPFSPESPPTDDVTMLTDQLQRADAILLGTPVYHGSYSGVLKNAIDHCGFDEFADKTVGLLAIAGGRFPVTALEHLRSVCRALNAWVLPYEAAIPQSSETFHDGEIIEPLYAERVDELGQRLVEYAIIKPHQASFEGDENVGG